MSEGVYREPQSKDLFREQIRRSPSQKSRKTWERWTRCFEESKKPAETVTWYHDSRIPKLKDYGKSIRSGPKMMGKKVRATEYTSRHSMSSQSLDAVV